MITPKSLLIALISMMYIGAYAQHQTEWMYQDNAMNQYNSRFVIHDELDNIYFLGDITSDSNVLVALSPDGSFKWRKLMPFLSQNPRQLVADNAGGIYVLGYDHHGVLEKYDTAGNQVWSIALDTVLNRSTDLLIDASGFLYVNGTSYSGLIPQAVVQKVDPADGTIIWSSYPPVPNTPIYPSSTILLNHYGDVILFSAKDTGSQIACYALDKDSGTIILQQVFPLNDNTDHLVEFALESSEHHYIVSYTTDSTWGQPCGFYGCPYLIKSVVMALDSAFNLLWKRVYPAPMDHIQPSGIIEDSEKNIHVLQYRAHPGYQYWVDVISPAGDSVRRVILDEPSYEIGYYKNLVAIVGASGIAFYDSSGDKRDSLSPGVVSSITINCDFANDYILTCGGYYNDSASGALITKWVVSDTTTNAIEVTGEAGFRVYPNPATDEITILLNEQALRWINLYNAMGQLLVYTELKNQEQMVVDISKFPEGIYFLQAGTNSRQLMKKFLISR